MTNVILFQLMSIAGPAISKERSDVFVCIPSFNHAPFVEKCLRSIITQTLPPKKLLVIDDGSRDESPAIIERVLRDCRFDSELIVRENRGLCATLNQGLEMSSGHYFAYLGSDDFWLPNFLEERAKLLNTRTGAVLGYGHAYIVDDSDRVFACTADFDEDWSRYADGNPLSMLVNGVSPVSSTVFYRRSLLPSAPWNEDANLEDYELYVKLMQFGEFAFDPQVLSAWRQHGYNTSRNLELMQAEVMAAQNRNVDIFGVEQNELRRAQSRSRFRYARDLLQHGQKRAALRLLKGNWHNADSPASVAKPLLQLILPERFLRFYQERKRKRRIRRFGNIKI
jgi:alpha-1,3-rhamnosyltransferase